MNIDNTVDYYFSFFKKKRIFDIFDGLEKDLMLQYSNLKSSDLDSDVSMIQEYFLEIYTGIENDFYEISWSIPKAEKIINKYNIKDKIISPNLLYSDFNRIDINSEKLKELENKNSSLFEPIIVVFYLPINKFIVIDGNHRLCEVMKRKEKSIRAYILAPHSNLLTMNERNYKLYTFHHNLVVLYSYCKLPFNFRINNNNSLKANSYNGNFKNFDNSLIYKLKVLFS